ncbi:ras-like protein 1 isoform X2 [Gadus morhua]|uniref:small monomeric GTPase n=1 Tax=Gadus morhua TaxID=8049 RepID=A0A8C5AF82_GADMO|nr:ras-like protein 1 isoform X2 [Gadus morhua]
MFTFTSVLKNLFPPPLSLSSPPFSSPPLPSPPLSVLSFPLPHPLFICSSSTTPPPSVSGRPIQLPFSCSVSSCTLQPPSSDAGSTSPALGIRLGSRTEMVPVKLLVMGSQDTGKTALCVRFVTGRFIGDYDRKKEMTYKCHRVCNQESVHLEILDRTSKECPQASVESCIRWADGFLLLYSITQRVSFLEVEPIKKLIDHIKQSPAAPTVLIANKADLETGREVTTEEGQNLAKDLRCSFKELSVSETAVAVEAAVVQLTSLVMAQQRPLLPDRPSYMVTVRHALTRKLIRSKTMQW